MACKAFYGAQSKGKTMRSCSHPIFLHILGAFVCTAACLRQFLSRNAVTTDPTGLNEPFAVIWNTETQFCKRHYGINIDVKRYGIVENNEGDGWIGDNISLIYHPGLWPSIATNGSEINGGVPQAGNITAHLNQVNTDILRQIPDVNFHGYGVIDFEKWRPVWETNLDALEPYRTKSRQIVQSAHPEWTPEQVEIEAKQEFEWHARRFMEETLSLVRLLRPHARWGYYGYPFCFLQPGDRSCSNNSYTWNERISWLANASTVIYPSIYFYESDQPGSREGKAYAGVRAAQSWRPSSHNTSLPIMVYSKFSLSMPVPFYSLDDLKNSLGLSSALGADGVILWGDHLYERNTTTCSMTETYVKSVLGPYVQKILNGTEFPHM